jgi:group I intron endonuclease
MYYIYLITFPNDKVYVGQSKNIKKRWYEHKRLGKKGNERIILYEAIHKYGVDSISFDIIDKAETLKKINQKEIQYIVQYHSYIHDLECNGYNMTLGGEGTEGHIGLKGQAASMSLTSIAKRNNCSLEEAKKLTPMYGKVRDEYTKQRASETHKGKILSEETKEKIRAKTIKYSYTLTNTETGEIFITTSLNQWCKDHKIERSILSKRVNTLEQRPRKKLKEWNIQKIDLTS